MEAALSGESEHTVEVLNVVGSAMGDGGGHFSELDGLTVQVEDSGDAAHYSAAYARGSAVRWPAMVSVPRVECAVYVMLVSPFVFSDVRTGGTFFL